MFKGLQVGAQGLEQASDGRLPFAIAGQAGLEAGEAGGDLLVALQQGGVGALGGGPFGLQGGAALLELAQLGPQFF